MSENYPQRPQESEPQSTEPEAAPTLENQASPPATKAGQFRTAPLDMDAPFAQEYKSRHSATAAPNYPTQSYTREYPQAGALQPVPQSYAQQGYAQSGYTQPGYPQPGYPQVGSAQQGYPQSTATHRYSGSAAPGYTQPGNPQPPGRPQQPYPGQLPNGSATVSGPATPNGQMPMRPTQPPRRTKPKPENLPFAHVTGSMPLTGDDVTEIPADGPIEWPRKRVGILGVANLVLSAVMAVIWAWIPLGLLFTGIGGIFALGLGVLALLVWVVVQQGANVFERYRAELIYGDRIPVPKIERSTRPSGFTRFLHNRWLHVKSGSFWRSTAHHYVKMLFGVLIVAGTIAGICGAVIGIFSAINPEGISTYFIGGSTGGLGRIGVAIGSLIVLASSVAILWFAPYLDRALDRSLLPPARTAALQAEVTELDRARMAGIEAAAAERLRIERDLHDGAQPRLVALSMTLGMAKSKIDTDPERAKELVSEAHAESKGIVNELRQLARGIHPAVLTDRGLDAAVSALAGRSPIPVEVDVRLIGRIDREAEAVAYFVVAECLTNIAKHSGATQARVFVAPIDAGVQIVVTDNGRGGARIDRSGRHTGIAGLIDRVEAARGTLNLTSPAGGPTTVVVEVPCAS